MLETASGQERVVIIGGGLSGLSAAHRLVTCTSGPRRPVEVVLLEAKDLFINQSALTGEAMPVEKQAGASEKDCADSFDLPNLCFMGANVVSGYGTGVILRTGPNTFFDQLPEVLAKVPPLPGEEGRYAMIKAMLEATVETREPSPFVALTLAFGSADPQSFR